LSLRIDSTMARKREVNFLQLLSDEATRQTFQLWATDYLRYQFPKLSESAAFLVLVRLKKTFVPPEGSWAFRSYVKKVVDGVLAEELAKKRAEGARYRPGSLRDVAAQLTHEGYEVSAATLSRWRKPGRIQAIHDQESQRQIKEIILHNQKERDKESRSWKALQDYWVNQGEEKGNKNPQAAAKKRLSRYRKRGKRPQDIAGAILGRTGAPEEAEE